MYLQSFGLSEKPFSVTPDPAFLYLGLQYEEVLSGLTEAIRERKGLIGLLGEAGTGKTTLINAVLERLDSKTKTAFLFSFSTHVSFADMLLSALVDLGVAEPDESISKMEAIQRLHSFAIQQLVSGGNVLLIVDEAQNLSPAVMEDLRLLSNLETRKHKLIQTLLAGQSGLWRFLQTPGLENVNERITKWFHLYPLAEYEVELYIRHRLTIAGSQGAVNFDRHAIDAVHSNSRGNPRRINTICDRALLITYCEGKSVVEKQAVLRALRDIEGQAWQPRTERKWLNSLAAPVTAALILGFTLGSVGKFDLAAQVSDLVSAVEKVTVFQGRAFVGASAQMDKSSEHRIPKEMEANPTKEGVEEFQADDFSNVLLDEQASLVKLFRLFDDSGFPKDLLEGDIYPGLFSLETSGGLYRELQQPFRIRLTERKEDKPLYLLAMEITPDGVLALDRTGATHRVPHEFVESHWGGEISWIYPYEAGNKQLRLDMSGSQVLRVQKMLRKAGYDVRATGVFDRETKNAIAQFQEKLGLWADGVVGTRTKALLFQVAG